MRDRKQFEWLQQLCERESQTVELRLSQAKEAEPNGRQDFQLASVSLSALWLRQEEEKKTCLNHSAPLYSRPFAMEYAFLPLLGKY